MLTHSFFLLKSLAVDEDDLHSELKTMKWNSSMKGTSSKSNFWLHAELIIITSFDRTWKTEYNSVVFREVFSGPEQNNLKYALFSRIFSLKRQYVKYFC